jgi:rod shape-determining protein MreC
MRNILILIQRFHTLLIFLVLEIFCIIIIIQNNHYHRSAWFKSSSDLVGSIYTRRARLSEYLRLGEINDELSLENAILRSRLEENFLEIDTSKFTVSDSIHQFRYTYMPAKVINNSVNRPSNFITINRGKMGGIKPDMGVIANGSIVGYVKDVSKHFAIVTPVLNSAFIASVKMKGSGDFGQLVWGTTDPLVAVVKEIPKHVSVETGDTVVTTGYSSFFPAEVMVGVVYEHEERPDEVFHRITVKLSTDFRKLNYVEVVSDILKTEQDSLQIKNAIVDGD